MELLQTVAGVVLFVWLMVSCFYGRDAYKDVRELRGRVKALEERMAEKGGRDDTV